MARFILNISTVAFVGALLASAASCADNDNSLAIEDRPGYKEGNDLWLSVDLRSLTPNGGRASRAADNAEHPDEAGSDAENYIDVNDVKVLFVGPNGTVMRVLQQGDYTVVRTSETDNYTSYTLAFKINREYFSTSLPNPTFQLMVVANAQGPTGAADNFEFTMENTWAKTPQQVANMLTTFSYSPTTAWSPTTDENNHNHIPMSGIVKTSYTTNALDAATSQTSAFSAGTINMQRAMAKLRIIDKIQENDPTMTAVSISEVRLAGYATKGAYFPAYNEANKAWYTSGTCPLETATMQERWYNNGPDKLYTSKNKYSESSKEYNAFIGYMPELTTKDFHPDINTYPTFEIDVTGIDGPNSKKTYITGLPNNSIVRNHIYEYSIKLEPNLKLSLEVTVNPWVENTFEYDLSDVVSFDTDKNLTWHTDSNLFSTGEKTYNGKAEMQLTISDAGTDDKAVKGTFTLASPRGATWTAYFIPGENGSGAFEFVEVDSSGNIIRDADENIIGKPAVSGKVGEAAEIYLHAATEADAFNHYAELVVEVRTVDGHVQYAPIGLKGGSNRYVIFRQKTQ